MRGVLFTPEGWVWRVVVPSLFATLAKHREHLNSGRAFDLECCNFWKKFINRVATCIHWWIFVPEQGFGLALGAHGSCTVLEGLDSTSSPGLARGRATATLLQTSKQIPIRTPQLVLRLIRMRINISRFAGKEPRICFQNAQNNYKRHRWSNWETEIVETDDKLFD